MKSLFAVFILVNIFMGCKNKELTLKTKSIVVTAPEIYASRLKVALEKYDAHVVLMPSIKTSIHDSLPQLKTSIGGRTHYNYIVLPSRNAIYAFDREIKRKNAFDTWKEGPYYVIGKDLELLEQLGYSTTKKQGDPSLQGIAKIIKKEGNYAQKKLLLISPKVIGMQEPPIVPDFIECITQMNIECQRIDGYTSEAISKPSNKRILANLKTGKYDMIAFTSGGECYSLGSQTKPFSINAKIACFGPYTAKSAERMNFRIDLISDNYHSFDDYAKSIANYFNEAH